MTDLIHISLNIDSQNNTSFDISPSDDLTIICSNLSIKYNLNNKVERNLKNYLKQIIKEGPQAQELSSKYNSINNLYYKSIEDAKKKREKIDQIKEEKMKFFIENQTFRPKINYTKGEVFRSISKPNKKTKKRHYQLLPFNYESNIESNTNRAQNITTNNSNENTSIIDENRNIFLIHRTSSSNENDLFLSSERNSENNSAQKKILVNSNSFPVNKNSNTSSKNYHLIINDENYGNEEDLKKENFNVEIGKKSLGTSKSFKIKSKSKFYNDQKEARLSIGNKNSSNKFIPISHSYKNIHTVSSNFTQKKSQKLTKEVIRRTSDKYAQINNKSYKNYFINSQNYRELTYSVRNSQSNFEENLNVLVVDSQNKVNNIQTEPEIDFYSLQTKKVDYLSYKANNLNNSTQNSKKLGNSSYQNSSNLISKKLQKKKRKENEISYKFKPNISTYYESITLTDRKTPQKENKKKINLLSEKYSTAKSQKTKPISKINQQSVSKLVDRLTNSNKVKEISGSLKMSKNLKISGESSSRYQSSRIQTPVSFLNSDRKIQIESLNYFEIKKEKNFEKKFIEKISTNLKKFRLNQLKEIFEVIIKNCENFNDLNDIEELGITKKIKESIVLPAFEIMKERELEINFQNFFLISNGLITLNLDKNSKNLN